MPLFSPRSYARIIPSEELGDCTQWKFGAVDGSDRVAPAVQIPAAIDEAAQQALLQQACADAHAAGLAQGQEQTASEWQHRLDEYIVHQGHAAAERLQGVLQALDASLLDMQRRMAQQLLALACDIAREVLRQELSVNPEALHPVVREALGMLVAEGRPASVRLNPADMQGLTQPLRAALATPQQVQWMADAAVPPGGCLVECAGSVVDGSVEKRWQRALAALGIESPWQEGGGDAR
ncbi:FliH/SctL family protein [Verminephrobacter aporrectodeae]|uniref:FliH/SctL family protein n=1 Tax=Verminephrobacter aporrectodeae TaxID=1110389 RepID=UPI002244B3E1|nr:flagellar assembly protein FliH [Verminephrobacter aporrectodeae]MCW8174023.1 flagellar assembly protein FliH [Verminephrobacter aporrectodeae subsp. tuberculatae]MCW8198453.1 flagellar assembly protein FliH [Verminephrobacter aporrectodeae subsp. tuberculatae]MCW8201692.1 flagellar assembly protein FliH [Verminephrobacter aporrectodeae subsp. tuberculatae]